MSSSPAQLKAGVTVKTIHQRLADEQQLAASYASLRRYVAANVPEDVRREQVRVLRLAPREPGEEAQIDYGQLGRWPDPVTGARHVVWAFVMVLCCSRHMFVCPVIRLDQYSWCESHVAASGFFGGVPARLVPDNLKTGAARPGMARRSTAPMRSWPRYGCLVDPARSRKPRDKPKAERPMPYIRDSFWRGREFGSLPRMQTEAVRWCREVAGMRASRRWTAPPAAVFAAPETRLAPLPAAGSSSRSGAPQGRPTSTLGRQGAVFHPVAAHRHDPGRAAGLFDGAVLRPRRAGQDPSAQGTRQADLPGRLPAGEGRAFHARPGMVPPPGRAHRPGVREVIDELMAENALYRLRAAQGVIGLAGKHEGARLEAACARAIEAGDPCYKIIRGILAAGTGTLPLAAPAGDGGAGAFLRGPARSSPTCSPSPPRLPAPPRTRPPRPRAARPAAAAGPGCRHDRGHGRTRPGAGRAERGGPRPDRRAAGRSRPARAAPG